MHPHSPKAREHVENEFGRFIGKHSKNYNTIEEHETRKNIFMHNLRYIHSKNRAKLGFSLAVNHLADKNTEELKAMRGYRSSGVYNGTTFISF